MANNDNRTPEQIKEELGLLEDEKDVREELEKLTEAQLGKLRDVADLEDKLLGLVQKTLLSKRNSIENLKLEIGHLQDIIDKGETKYAQQVAIELKKEAELELGKRQLDQMEKQLKLGKKIDLQKHKQLQAQQAENEFMQELQSLPGVKTLLKMKAAPGKTMGLMGLAAIIKYSRAVKKMAIDMHDMEAALMKATGASKDFARAATQVYEAQRRYGVTAEDASNSMQALYTGFTDFTFASERQRKSLMDTGAILGRMGISHQDFAASVQISTKALGMSTEEAGQNMLNMEKFAENIGVAPAEMAKQFAGAGNMMAKMGDQGVGAFKDLAIAAKVSGMQMEKILQLTNKFDTFEGAAEMAGKLNAAMGGNFVNAMDMMMATNPAERFEMIRDSLDQAGLSWDDMSYYQKKFYADSLGLSDVSELALVMSGNTESLAGATEKSSQSIEEAAKRAQTMASFQEKLNMVFVQMIPVLTDLADVVGDFFVWLADHPKTVKGVTAALGGLAVLAVGLAAPFIATKVAVVGAIAAVVALAKLLFTEKMSPFTFLGGLGEIQKTFEGIGGAMDALPTKKGLELTTSMTNNTVAKVGGAPGVAATAAAGGARTTETVRQPISIELKGEKLADFVVEVVGEKVYEINYA